MEDIKNNITNGNWEDTVRLVKNSNYSVEQVLEDLCNDQFYGQEDALRLVKYMFIYGFLQVHNDYEY